MGGGVIAVQNTITSIYDATLYYVDAEVLWCSIKSVSSVLARLGKGQGAKEIGHNLAREQPKFGHNLVCKRHKIGHTFTRE